MAAMTPLRGVEFMQRFSLDQALRQARACVQAGRPDEARRIYNAAIGAFPGDARAQLALAELESRSPYPEVGQSPPPQTVEHLLGLCRNGAFEEAIAEAERLVVTFPGSYALWNALGGACVRTGRADRAEHAFRRAIALLPEYPGGHYNLGLVLHETGRLREAVGAYRKALRRNPDHVAAHNNLGNALADLGRPGEAEAAFRRALNLRPDYADAHSNLGRALKDEGRLEEAISAWEQALRRAPGHAAALSQKLRTQWQICDFSAYAEFAGLRTTLGIEGAKVPPSVLLPADDDPALQRLRSERWASCIAGAAPAHRPSRRKTRPRRLRIGYFSADFHDHPTLRLAAGMLREHDRTRFDVRVYSFGRQKTGELRRQLQKDVSEFHDVEHMSPRQIASLARSHRLDIAIDLNGYTNGARTEVFTFQPAKLAIGFLGFPSTMGADFIDYLVADATVIPDAERAHYSESVIFMPDTFMPTDAQQTVPETTDTRSDHGLPETGVVFCCFNNAFKIGPREFDIWMRLLRRTHGSVLWLLRSNAGMAGNLAREAAARGVDPTRLIFAEKLAHGAHLSRNRHADLFLDTFHYNAHTTTTDALRAGLPVVTMAGRQFASRVAASLLAAAGLPDLVASTEEQYEALASDLATDPARLDEVRHRLSQGRNLQPLFDTVRYTRSFEAAMDAVYDRYLCGQDPADIRVQSPAGT